MLKFPDIKISVYKVYILEKIYILKYFYNKIKKAIHKVIYVVCDYIYLNLGKGYNKHIMIISCK